MRPAQRRPPRHFRPGGIYARLMAAIALGAFVGTLLGTCAALFLPRSTARQGEAHFGAVAFTTPVMSLTPDDMDPRATEAMTTCYAGVGYTYIRDDVIDSPGFQMVRHHERVHREQLARETNPVRHDFCMRWNDPRQLLDDEIEAYCAVEPEWLALHEREGFGRDSVRRQFTGNLMGEFHGTFTDSLIAHRYLEKCP